MIFMYFSVARKLEGHLLMLERVAETQLSGAQLEQQAKSEAEAEAEVFFYYIRERLVCV
jgi:hypothetical protein